MKGSLQREYRHEMLCTLNKLLMILMVFGISCRSSEQSLDLIEIDAQGVSELVRENSRPILLINAWATWCQPCVEEFPMLVKTGQAFKSKGVDVVFVSMDFESDRDDVVEFLKSQGVQGRTYIRKGPDGEFIDALNEQWEGTLPATFVYDANRKLIHYWPHMLLEKNLHHALDALVKSQK